MNLNERPFGTLYERDIDMLLLEELQSSNAFCAWFAARVFGRAIFGRFESAMHSQWDIDGRESDLVFRFYDSSGSEQLHLVYIENKINAVFQLGQEQAYGERVGRARANPAFGEVACCLVAPRAYIKRSASATFDLHMEYEELLAYFVSNGVTDPRAQWKARVVLGAINKQESSSTFVPDVGASDFANAYYHLVQMESPHLQMPPGKPRAAGHTWFQFEPAGIANGLQIVHQSYGGAVKMFFDGSFEHFAEIVDRLERHLPRDARIEAAGKSVAISIAVPPIKSLQVPFDTVLPHVRKAIAAASELASFAVSPVVNELVARLRSRPY